MVVDVGDTSSVVATGWSKQCTMAGRQDNVDKNHHLYAKQICWKRNACENADRTVKHMVARTDFMRKKTEANAK